MTDPTAPAPGSAPTETHSVQAKTKAVGFFSRSESCSCSLRDAGPRADSKGRCSIYPAVACDFDGRVDTVPERCPLRKGRVTLSFALVVENHATEAEPEEDPEVAP